MSSFWFLHGDTVYPFKGFEAHRFQQHDSLICEVVLDFNVNKVERVGCTPDQAQRIPVLLGALVKAWMIQESGGSDIRSRAAWKHDPLQVNVPEIGPKPNWISV